MKKYDVIIAGGSCAGAAAGFTLATAGKSVLIIDKAVFPGMQGGPLMHIIAAKAICFLEAMKPGFKDYQRQIVKNAQALAGALTARGFRIEAAPSRCTSRRYRCSCGVTKLVALPVAATRAVRPMRWM